jgi:hypothetical protein
VQSNTYGEDRWEEERWSMGSTYWEERIREVGDGQLLSRGEEKRVGRRIALMERRGGQWVGPMERRGVVDDE